MAGSILGTRVTRVEDPDLLRGLGSFVDDVRVEGLTSLAFVRSPIAHGRVAGIDASTAAAQPGVVAVLTAAEMLTAAAEHRGAIEFARRVFNSDRKETHWGRHKLKRDTT